MNNDSRFFESKLAFRTLIGILLSLALLSAANYYVSFYEESSEVSIDSDNGVNKSYSSTADAVGYKYEVIAENGAVNVYSIAPNGDRAFFCETEIPFYLLSENDKRLMKDGVILDTMEELSNILQDFES